MLMHTSPSCERPTIQCTESLLSSFRARWTISLFLATLAVTVPGAVHATQGGRVHLQEKERQNAMSVTGIDREVKYCVPLLTAGLLLAIPGYTLGQIFLGAVLVHLLQLLIEEEALSYTCKHPAVCQAKKLYIQSCPDWRLSFHVVSSVVTSMLSQHFSTVSPLQGMAVLVAGLCLACVLHAGSFVGMAAREIASARLQAPAKAQ